MRIAILMILLAAACGGGGTPGDDTGDDDTSGAPDAGGVGATCGGFAGAQCDEGLWCDWPDDSCGGVDGVGSCQVRPTGCGDNYQPVCACDGTVYSNACDAQAAGSDVNAYGACEAPPGFFACGAGFCNLADSYCRRIVSDVAGYPDDWSCEPAPAGCGDVIDCDCLIGELCSAMCEQTGQGYRLTCPGG